MLPPTGAVPQTQVQGGIPAAPQAPKGAAPQAQAQNGKVPPDQIELLRKDPEVIEVFKQITGGKATVLDQVPEELILEIAGMVHKLGVNGAVAMLNKVIPEETRAKLRGGK